MEKASEMQSAETLRMHEDMLSRALRSYWGNLKTSIRARRYLKERGITVASIERFGLGYAESGAHSLRTVFPNYHVPALADCGLVIDGERGRYDRFRDRIMFPILNDHGRVIAFGGRIIDGDAAKYLNSPQTALFDKGNTLFGLPQARPAIDLTGEAIVMEGYLDVVMCAQHGIENVVATLGTATTAGHVSKLLALASKRLVFCFDGDNAGQTAANRALDACVAAISDGGAEVLVTFLPADEDPDSFVRHYGADAFRGLIARATPFEVCIVDHLANGKDLDTCEGRAHMLSEAIAMLTQLQDAGLYYRLCEAIADHAGVTNAELIALTPSEQPRTWHRPREAKQSADSVVATAAAGQMEGLRSA